MSILEEVGNRGEPSKNNEVFAAYDELLRQLSGTKPAPTEPEKKAVEEKKQTVETATKEVAAVEGDMESYVNALKSMLVKSLDDLGPKLVAEAKKFATLQQANTIQSKELDELYKIRMQADTLAALITANKQKSVTLEQEIIQKRTQWQKEQETHDAVRKDQETQLANTRQREEENYIYNRDIFRRKEQEEYEMKKRELEQELNAKRTTLEESFRNREAELTMRENKIVSREAEIQHLQDEVRTFPERIQVANQEAERILADKLQIKFEYEAKLLQKEFETERQSFRQAIEALERKIKHLETLNYSFKPLAYNTDQAPTEV